MAAGSGQKIAAASSGGNVPAGAGASVSTEALNANGLLASRTGLREKVRQWWPYYAMMAVREAGLDCPRDVSILGFDGIPSGEFAWPGLTTVAKPGRNIGERAVE